MLKLAFVRSTQRVSTHVIPATNQNNNNFTNHDIFTNKTFIMSSPANDSPKKSDSGKFETDQWFCFTSYCKITSLNVPEKPDSFKVETLDGQTWDISKNIVERSAWTTEQFTRTEHVTRADLESKLEHAGDTIFCVHFNKKPDYIENEKSLAKMLESGELDTQRKRRKLCRDMLEGEERTMRGFLKSSHAKLGYFMVYDLEKRAERQVNARSLRWLIIKGVKYTTEKA